MAIILGYQDIILYYISGDGQSFGKSSWVASQAHVKLSM